MEEQTHSSDPNVLEYHKRSIPPRHLATVGVLVLVALIAGAIGGLMLIWGGIGLYESFAGPRTRYFAGDLSAALICLLFGNICFYCAIRWIFRTRAILKGRRQ